MEKMGIMTSEDVLSVLTMAPKNICKNVMTPSYCEFFNILFLIRKVNLGV